MSNPIARSPLSANQQFVRAYDVGNQSGPFGPHYTITHAWWCDGAMDLAQVRSATDRLVVRHEALSTLIEREPDGACAMQVVHAPSPALVEERDGSASSDPETRALALLDEEELRPLPSEELPLLRVTLVRFGPRRHLMILTAHHLSTDGFAMRVLVTDLAHLLAQEQGRAGHELDRPSQYRDYALWESAIMSTEIVEGHRQYWRANLAGARIHTWPTDFRRSEGREPGTGTIRFVIEPATTQRVLDVARLRRCTPFMAYLAIYALACQPDAGDDLTIPSFTPGRSPEFTHTVGSFFNFMPLRVDLSHCQTFDDVLEQVRNAVLDGAEHDIPAIPGVAPETMGPAMQDDRATGVFQVFPFPDVLDDSLIGNIRYTEVRRRVDSQLRAAEIPDGTLWTITIDPVTRETIGCLSYRSDLYEPGSARVLVDRFLQQLRSVASSDPVMVS